MNTQERNDFAFHYANIIANNVHLKMPHNVRRFIDKEDIAQDLFLIYWKKRDKFDLRKDFKLWIRKFYYNYRIKMVSKFWDETMARVSLEENFTKEYYTKEPMHNSSDYEVVVVDDDTPESILENKQRSAQEEERIKVVGREVKSLCKRFGLPFSYDNLLGSLFGVLDKTLNTMPDSEFYKLPVFIQKKLVKYGEAFKSNKIRISSNGKCRSTGISKVINECLDKGLYEFPQVRAYLNKNGIIFNEKSLRVLLCRYKKQRDIVHKNRNSSLKSQVKEIFHAPSGVTSVSQIADILKKRGIEYKSSTLQCYVGVLRSDCGLTR